MSLARLRSPALIGALVAVGIALRVWVIDSRLGAFNADEAYAGLQSIAVLRDGRFPVVIDGQSYTATVEAYLLSPILVLAGGSIAALKWLYAAIWGAAACVTFGAARALADRRTAVLSAAFVWLAPGALLVLSTTAYMGYAVGLTVVVGTVWAASTLADRPAAHTHASAIVGFLAGLAFYVHPMFAAVAIPIVAPAAFVHRRDWRRWWLPAVGGAIFANVPFLLWNAVNGWPSLTRQGYPPGSYIDRLKGFFTELLPRAFGLRKFDGGWVFATPLSVLLYLTILAAVVVGCVIIVRTSERPSRWIVPVGLLCLPLMALLPHLVYVDDGRYAIIPFPLIAIALGVAGTRLIASIKRQRAALALAGLAAAWVMVTTLPFLDRQHTALDDDPNAWQERVITRLEELGINRLAGTFWFVLPIEYRSDRAIRVAIAGNPYVIRFPDSQRLVQATPPDEVAFLFPPGEHDPGWFYLPVDAYEREDLGGMILYIPLAARA